MKRRLRPKNTHLRDLSDEVLVQHIQEAKAKKEQPQKESSGLYEELLRRHSEGLFRYAVRKFGYGVEDAEDYLQDVLKAFVETLDEPSTEVRFVKAWLYRVMRNRCIGKKRWRKVREGHVSKDGPAIDQLESQLDNADKPGNTDLTTILREDREWLKEALSRLTSVRRKVMETHLAFKLDLEPQVQEELGLPTVQEIDGRRDSDRGRTELIAAQLGISYDSATTELHRARSYLRKWYREEMRM